MNKVVFLVFEFPPGPGGIGQHAYSVSKALLDSKHQVYVITSADYVAQHEIDQFDQANPEFHIRRIQGWALLKYIKRIWFTIVTCLREKPDQVICSGKFALWLIPVVKMVRFGKIKVSAFLHGSEVKRPFFLERWSIYASLMVADRIYCVSRFTMTLLPSAISKRKSTTILPNGLNVKWMPKHWETLAIDSYSGSPSLLTVGQLTNRKGQHRVIKALPHLLKFWPELVYHMVGMDTNRKSLEELAKSLGVEQHIHVHGRLADKQAVFKAYCSTDICIMLSENQKDGDVEGFGIAILEANYFGQPAIGAKNCGIEDAILEGTNGYLVDGDNQEEIQQAIAHCLARRNEMQHAMKSWVNQHDWDHLIRAFSV